MKWPDRVSIPADGQRVGEQMREETEKDSRPEKQRKREHGQHDREHRQSCVATHADQPGDPAREPDRMCRSTMCQPAVIVVEVGESADSDREGTHAEADYSERSRQERHQHECGAAMSVFVHAGTLVFVSTRGGD